MADNKDETPQVEDSKAVDPREEAKMRMAAIRMLVTSEPKQYKVTTEDGDETTVRAHGLAIEGNGSVSFWFYRYDPLQGGLLQVTTRVLFTVKDVEELAPSALITH